MSSYLVDNNKLIFDYQMEVPLDSEEAEKVISDIDKNPLYYDSESWKEFAKIYRTERQKYIDSHSAQSDKTPDTAPKVNLDTSDLDAAIAKVDELIAKLKTAQLLIVYLNKQD